MNTRLQTIAQGYYELFIKGTNVSFMIELDEEHTYSVTMLENYEAVDFIGSYDTRNDAVEDIEKRIIHNLPQSAR